MKTKKLNKKLGLKKETVVNLSTKELSDVRGGGTIIHLNQQVFTEENKCPTYYEECHTSTCDMTALMYTCNIPTIPTYLYTVYPDRT